MGEPGLSLHERMPDGGYPRGGEHDPMTDMAAGATIEVLSVGGFLGIGERCIAIPVSDLRWNNERGRWMLPGATALEAPIEVEPSATNIAQGDDTRLQLDQPGEVTSPGLKLGSDEPKLRLGGDEGNKLKLDL